MVSEGGGGGFGVHVTRSARESFELADVSLSGSLSACVLLNQISVHVHVGVVCVEVGAVCAVLC